MHADIDKARNKTDKRKSMFKEREKKDERRARDWTEKRRRMHLHIDKERNQTSERKKMFALYDKSRDQNSERKELHTQIDRARDQTGERKELHAQIDRARDKSSKRKQFHADIDKVRDKTKKRKEFHAALDRIRYRTPARRTRMKLIDQNRNKTEARKFYRKSSNKLRNQRKILESLSTDTGFDVICKVYCKSINLLSKEKKHKFVVKYCHLLRNRSNEQYICNLCFKDIQKDKYPKRTNKLKFKYANFPLFLKKQLEKVCFDGISGKEDFTEKELHLNRLETYLHKLIIPFICIVRCGRGNYLKVKGDLILISADITHSLNKILPVQQDLVPVRFKRKLSYHGSYIEEFIDKKKVGIIFQWLKKYNYLYKEVQLDTNLIEEFQEEAMLDLQDFEKVTTWSHEEFPSGKDDEIAVEVSDGDSENSFSYEAFEPYTEKESKTSQEHTTMFINKYFEDTSIPSVANRLSDIVIQYEVANNISCSELEDAELDDEVVGEEEYLNDIDEKNDSFLLNEGFGNEKVQVSCENVQHIIEYIVEGGDNI